MKLQIEQIELQEDLLVYSNYMKDTITLDEDGVDYEYDFKAFINNLDNIQNVALRLYGEQGLIHIMGHYADGAEGKLVLDKIEYVQGSRLLEKIRRLQKNSNVATVLRKVVNPNPIKKEPIPTDDVYLLTGWLEALAENDDLNVLKMVGKVKSDLSEDEISKCQELLSQSYFDLNFESAIYFGFDYEGSRRGLIVLSGRLFLVSIDNKGVVLYPGNEFQEKTCKLLKKFMKVKSVYKLKTSVIIEGEIKNQGYYLLFNAHSSKFESKKKIQ